MAIHSEKAAGKRANRAAHHRRMRDRFIVANKSPDSVIRCLLAPTIHGDAGNCNSENLSATGRGKSISRDRAGDLFFRR